MSRTIHEFREPARFVTGTVGQPGDRTFFIQVTADPRTVSVQLEKQQLLILADRLGFLLDEVQRRFGTQIPPATGEVRDTSPLATPIDTEFRVGTMGLGWDADGGCVVVELLAATDQPLDESVILDDSDNGPDTVRVYLAPDAAREFTARSMRVIAAGRPPCPLCAYPLDPSGHLCVRTNGYRRGTAISEGEEFITPETFASLGRMMPGFDASFSVDDAGRVHGPWEVPGSAPDQTERDQTGPDQTEPGDDPTEQ